MPFDRFNTVVMAIAAVVAVAVIAVCITVGNATADRKRVQQTEAQVQGCVTIADELDRLDCLRRVADS